MRNSTTYKIGGTKTFRLASSKILKRWGSNLQNVEQSLRQIYIPDGYSDALIDKCKFYLETGDYSVFKQEELETLNVFLQVDQSGAEALIVAYECEPKDYRQLFICGVKPHVYVALKLFKEQWKDEVKIASLRLTDSDIDLLSVTPIPSLKKNPLWKDLDTLIKKSDGWPVAKRYYYMAKQTCHSGNYDIQPPMFRMNVLVKSGGKIVLTKEQSVEFLQLYRGLFPEIPERNERIRRQVDKTRILYNLFGHPYYISNYNITERTYKEYYAWSAQSTVGSITRVAFCSMQEFIESERKKWDLMQDNHDSYLIQCKLSDAIECGKKAQEFMNQELTSPFDGTKFRMKSELQVGFNWSKSNKDNPVGLTEVTWI